YFFFKYIPHYIWIDSNGIVAAFSESREVDQTNIDLAVSKRVFNFSSKHDYVIEYDMGKMLVENVRDPLAVDHAYHRSFMPYQRGFKSVINIQTDSIRGRKITCLNLSRYWLYLVAYSENGISFSKANTILDVKDPERFTTDLRGQDILAWRANGNAYCYELIVPYDIRNSCFRIMQDDLRKLFPE